MKMRAVVIKAADGTMIKGEDGTSGYWVVIHRGSPATFCDWESMIVGSAYKNRQSALAHAKRLREALRRERT